jgi:hypothetical protein
MLTWVNDYAVSVWPSQLTPHQRRPSKPHRAVIVCILMFSDQWFWQNMLLSSLTPLPLAARGLGGLGRWKHPHKKTG